MVGWCEGSGQTSVPGRPTNFGESRARAYTALAVDAGGDCLFVSLVYIFSVFLPLWKTALKR